MGMISADIELSNPRQPDLSPLLVRALVDTGAMTITVNPTSPNLPSAIVK